jgi:hypothetical protein
MLDVPFAELTPEQRLRRLAAILAHGVRRYHQRLRRCQCRRENEVPETSPASEPVANACTFGPCPENDVPETSPPGLEVPSTPRLNVSQRIRV